MRDFLIQKARERLGPILSRVKGEIMPFEPKFNGFNMATAHAVPWAEESIGDYPSFVDVNARVKSEFDFSGEVGVTPETVDSLMWRHWHICYAVRHAVMKTKMSRFVAVECGAMDGLTALYTCRELAYQKSIGAIKEFEVALYDSWSPMRENELMASEIQQVGKFSTLNVERVKKNLHAYADSVTLHPGFIPESLTKDPGPDEIGYLHIDLNAALPSVASLEHFFPRLKPGGLVIFDDYGWSGYEDTRRQVNAFFKGKPGVILPLATGQAIYYT